VKLDRLLLTLWTCVALIGLEGCNPGRPTLAPLHTSRPATATPTNLSATPAPPPSPSATPAPTVTTTTTATATSAPSATPAASSTPTVARTTTPTATATPTPVPTRTPIAPGEGTAATLHTPDGLALVAALYLPDGEGPFPGVVLAHMGGSNKEAWGDVPKLLRLAGYAVVSFDFRGHGQSAGDLDPPRAATDLGTALAFLRAHPQVDGGRIGLVGASMGGMASVIVGADDPQVRAVVAISSSPDAAGQYPGQVVGQLSPRPFLVIGCDEDPLTKPERVRQLYEGAGAPKQMEILECAAHANDILETQAGPRLRELVLMWLNDHVKAGP
jgi:dienelactone hydrolase